MFAIVIIKPDAYNVRHRILDYFKNYDIQILAGGILMEKAFIEELYAVHKNKSFFNELVSYMRTGPVLIFKASSEDPHLISNIRNIVENVIRPKYAINKTANSVHASDSEEAAQYEYDVVKKWLKIK